MVWNPFRRKETEVEKVFAKVRAFLRDDEMQNQELPEELTSRMKPEIMAVPDGMAGWSPLTPIAVNGPVGAVVYLSSLQHERHGRIAFHRIGELMKTDLYEYVTYDGAAWGLLWVDMYHVRKTPQTPKGFVLHNDCQIRGINQTLETFPVGIADAARDGTERMIGFAAYDQRMRESRVETARRPAPYARKMEEARAKKKPPTSIDRSMVPYVVSELLLRDIWDVWQKRYAAFLEAYDQFLATYRIDEPAIMEMREHPALKMVFLSAFVAAYRRNCTFILKDAGGMIHDAISQDVRSRISEPAREFFDEIASLVPSIHEARRLEQEKPEYRFAAAQALLSSIGFASTLELTRLSENEDLMAPITKTLMTNFSNARYAGFALAGPITS